MHSGGEVRQAMALDEWAVATLQGPLDPDVGPSNQSSTAVVMESPWWSCLFPAARDWTTSELVVEPTATPSKAKASIGSSAIVERAHDDLPAAAIAVATPPAVATPVDAPSAAPVVATPVAPTVVPAFARAVARAVAPAATSAVAPLAVPPAAPAATPYAVPPAFARRPSAPAAVPARAAVAARAQAPARAVMAAREAAPPSETPALPPAAASGAEDNEMAAALAARRSRVALAASTETAAPASEPPASAAPSCATSSALVARVAARADADESSRLPIHLRGRLPAPPPEKNSNFLGDYGLRSKPVSMPPMRRDLINARLDPRLGAMRKSEDAGSDGGERKRMGDSEENVPPRQPHAGEESRKIANQAVKAQLELLKRQQLEPLP